MCMRNMISALLLPLSGLLSPALTGCGEGVSTQPPGEECRVSSMAGMGGRLVLGSALVDVPQGAFTTASIVSLCRLRYDGSGAVGPVFRLTSERVTARSLTVEMKVRPPGTARPGQTVTLAYRLPEQRWEGFSNHEYRDLDGVVRGLMDKRARDVVIGPVLTCSGNAECESGLCNTDVCQ